VRCRARSSAWTSIRPCHSSITALRPAASRAARSESGSLTVCPRPAAAATPNRSNELASPQDIGTVTARLVDGRAHAAIAGKKAPWKPQGTWCGKKARACGSSVGGSRASRQERPALPSRTTESRMPSSHPQPLALIRSCGIASPSGKSLVRLPKRATGSILMLENG
jgi:hypothetical protein